MQNPEHAPTIHPIYPILKDRQLLVVSQDPFLVGAADDELRAMQKMKVTETNFTPIMNHKKVPLETFVTQKFFDVCIINAHPYVIPLVDTLIEKNKPVLVREELECVDMETIDAIRRWQTKGVPIVRGSMEDLPFALSQKLEIMMQSGASLQK